MEYLQSLIVSILLAGIIIFFPAIKAKEVLPTHAPNKFLSQNDIEIKKPTVNPKMILSWINQNISDSKSLNSRSNVESFGDQASLDLKIADQRIILDIPEVIELKTIEDRIVLKTPKYWEVVHSIESKQGKRLYRPKNKEKSCENTSAPCGHYQISAQALKDIGCNTDQCKTSRENLKLSLTMSKSLEKLNLGRLAEKGYSHLPDYQKYLIHQQGAAGIRKILDAQDGRHECSKRLIKNMANNSSFSYKTLKNYGSRLAAKKFLKYWENKWKAEIDLIFAQQYKEQMEMRNSLQVASNLKF